MAGSLELSRAAVFSAVPQDEIGSAGALGSWLVLAVIAIS